MPQPASRLPFAAHRLSAVASAVLACLAVTLPSHAMEIDVGNPDLSIRWDNTLRYNLGFRTQAQDAALLGNPNLDDGDRNFNKGSAVANRGDWTTATMPPPTRW